MAGRPMIYKTKEEMQEIIDKYFDDCKCEYAYDDDGTIRTDGKGNVLYKKLPKVPTITGLALALNLGGRQAVLNYQGREEFKDTITRAKLLIEEYNQQRLYDREGFNGSRFNLSANFAYADRTENINIDMTYDQYINKVTSADEY